LSNSEAQVLTREWYIKLEEQAASNFVNLPIEFQIRGYDYNYIAKTYLTFFNSDDNTRQDKLNLAKKFLKFVRNINKNRAKAELGEDFFLCFQFFMDNFPDLMSKNDLISLETLDVITQAIDKSQFIEDIISVEELQRRVKNLQKAQEKEEHIIDTWSEFRDEYKSLNVINIRDKGIKLLEGSIKESSGVEENEISS